MDLFWARGYEGAGLAELLDAMGILRGSLYKAWGSKHGLFLAVLARYDALHVAPGIALLEGRNGAAGRSGAQRIDAVFAARDGRGCLMCNSVGGIAGTDPAVAAWIRGRLGRLKAAFAVALGGGPEAGRAEEAERLTQRYIGFRTAQRAGLVFAPGGAGGEPEDRDGRTARPPSPN